MRGEWKIEDTGHWSLTFNLNGFLIKNEQKVIQVYLRFSLILILFPLESSGLHFALYFFILTFLNAARIFYIISYY